MTKQTKVAEAKVAETKVAEAKVAEANNSSHTIVNNKSNKKVFRIMKTLKPDVYELYGMKNTDLNKVGVALVQTISESRMLCSMFSNVNALTEVRVECE